MNTVSSRLAASFLALYCLAGILQAQQIQDFSSTDGKVQLRNIKLNPAVGSVIVDPWSDVTITFDYENAMPADVFVGAACMNEQKEKTGGSRPAKLPPGKGVGEVKFGFGWKLVDSSGKLAALTKLDEETGNSERLPPTTSTKVVSSIVDVREVAISIYHNQGALGKTGFPTTYKYVESSVPVPDSAYELTTPTPINLNSHVALAKAAKERAVISVTTFPLQRRERAVSVGQIIRKKDGTEILAKAKDTLSSESFAPPTVTDYAVKDVQAWSLDGKPISSEKLQSLLATPAHVILVPQQSGEGAVFSKYLQSVFRTDLLLLQLPPQNKQTQESR